MSVKKLVLFLCILGFSFLHGHAPSEQYQFLGKHFIASYAGCDAKAIQNVEGLIEAMREGVRKSGAQILDESSYVFQGNGFTMVLLLSESHASIHTYPEHNACFVDLFTCGDHCLYDPFDNALRDYLKPTAATSKILIRNEAITEHTD